MKKFIYYIFFSALIINKFFLLQSTSLAKSGPALAVLSEIKGEVKAGLSNKLKEGYNGKMIWKSNYIKTEERSKTTIFFYDGSEIRLFEKSNLKIGIKKRNSNRWVRYRIKLINGSFWGYFARGDSPIEVSGKGINIFISNATIRFTKKENSHNIAATSGNIKVSNKISSAKLISGNRLYQVQKIDFLPQKISPIPNKLKIWIEPENPIFDNNNLLSINLFLKIVRSETGNMIKRPGPIFLRSNYYNLILPDSIKIDKNGEAKTILEIKPPDFKDRTFGGSVVFQAIMDQSGYDDVQDGSLKVRFQFP